MKYTKNDDIFAANITNENAEQTPDTEQEKNFEQMQAEYFKKEALKSLEKSKGSYLHKNYVQIIQLLDRGVPVSELLQEMRLQDRKMQLNYVSGDNDACTLVLHSHSFYELLYVTSGSVDYLIGSQRYRIQAGHLVFIPPDYNHCPLFPKAAGKTSHTYSRYTIWLDRSFFDSICNGHPDIGSLFASCIQQNRFLLCTSESSRRTLDVLCENLHQELLEQRPGWELYLTASILNLLVHICRNYFPEGVEPLREHSLVDDILCYIDTHLSDSLSLENMAEQFHVSKSTITHLFRNQLRIPFYRCVVERRLLLAKSKMLRGLPMHQVCEECGFSDYSAFYRLFKKEYGLSPTEYMKLRR